MNEQLMDLIVEYCRHDTPGGCPWAKEAFRDAPDEDEAIERLCIEHCENCPLILAYEDGEANG